MSSGFPLGNIRQMHNVLRTAVALLGEGNEITVDELSEDFMEQADCLEGVDDCASLSSGAETGDLLLADMEDRMISATLARSGGNIAETARKLGISRNTLYRKLRGVSGEGSCGATSV